MKGIILGGGSGTRMYPLSKVLNKHLLPVYNKPIIYYPMALMLQMGITEIIFISSPEYINNYKSIFGNGNQLGIDLTYITQPKPGGIAQSFILAENEIRGHNVCLILGDNIFYSENYSALESAVSNFNSSPNCGAMVCSYTSNHPQHYGVLEFDGNNSIVGIEEKPVEPKSNKVVTGLYFYNTKVAEYAHSLKPSARGELEITDLNNTYLQNGQLQVFNLDESYQWFDTGSYDNILEATLAVRDYEKNGKYIGCIEEIALKKGFINKATLANYVATIPGNSSYKQYLKALTI